MPAGTPAASSTVNGSIEPLACRPRRRSISAAMPSGLGIDVYQSFHSSPSRAALARAAACSCASGASVACVPCKVTGSGQAMVALALSVVALHEDELLEQAHVLFVLQQRADQRRHRDLLVPALQDVERDVFRDQQLQPVEQFG